MTARVVRVEGAEERNEGRVADVVPLGRKGEGGPVFRVKKFAPVRRRATQRVVFRGVVSEVLEEKDQQFLSRGRDVKVAAGKEEM